MHSSSGSKANILINNSGRACLADFSLLTIVWDQSAVISSWSEYGSVPWMSPELLTPSPQPLTPSPRLLTPSPEGGRPTKESDCYALGMVIYEVLSGDTPFAPYKGTAVIVKVLGGGRPERPQGHKGWLFTDVMWRVMELCWDARPNKRLSAEDVLQRLERNQPPSGPPPNVGGRADSTDSGGQSDATEGGSSVFSP